MDINLDTIYRRIAKARGVVNLTPEIVLGITEDSLSDQRILENLQKKEVLQDNLSTLIKAGSVVWRLSTGEIFIALQPSTLTLRFANKPDGSSAIRVSDDIVDAWIAVNSDGKSFKIPVNDLSPRPVTGLPRKKSPASFKWLKRFLFVAVLVTGAVSLYNDYFSLTGLSAGMLLARLAQLWGTYRKTSLDLTADQFQAVETL